MFSNRLVKDSSNDDDMFADSSGEESLKTFDFTNHMLSTMSSNIDSSKTKVAGSELRLMKTRQASESVASIPISSYPTQQDKAHLTKENAKSSMTVEEQAFFMQYSKGKNFQIGPILQ